MPDILPAVTRAVALMQLPQLESAMPHIRQSFQAEIAELEEQLTAAMAYPASTLLRAQPEQDSPVSVRSLQKRLLRMCSLQSARALRKQLASQDHSLAQEFERNLAYDDLKGQPVHEGLGAWLLHVPMKEHEQIPNAALSWALKLRVGLPIGPMPSRCARLLPSGAQCAAVLDVQHVHALTCSQAIALKRHNAVKHSLHTLALAAGASAASEQRAVWAATDRAPGPRAIHTADIAIMDKHGLQIAVDVRTTIKPPHEDMSHCLLRHERSKRSEYGHAVVTAPSAHGDGVRPVVVEGNGRCAPIAVALIHHLLHQHADALTAAWHMQWAQAIQHARKTFWGPLSVSLIKLSYAAWTADSQPAHTCLPLPDAELLADGLAAGLAELMDAELHEPPPPSPAATAVAL